jgi:hypothetical protein
VKQDEDPAKLLVIVASSVTRAATHRKKSEQAYKKGFQQGAHDGRLKVKSILISSHIITSIHSDLFRHACWPAIGTGFTCCHRTSLRFRSSPSPRPVTLSVCRVLQAFDSQHQTHLANVLVKRIHRLVQLSASLLNSRVDVLLRFLPVLLKLLVDLVCAIASLSREPVNLLAGVGSKHLGVLADLGAFAGGVVPSGVLDLGCVGWWRMWSAMACH